MTIIDAVSGPRSPRSTSPTARRADSGFRVPEDAGAGSPPAAQTATPGQIGGVSLDLLLTAEALDPDAPRNAAARRQGHAILRSLGALQQILLGGGDPGGALAELAQLIGDLPPAANPGLAAVLDSSALRARVELARHAR